MTIPLGAAGVGDSGKRLSKAFHLEFSVWCVVSLILFQGCATQLPAPSARSNEARPDGFGVRLESLTISDDSPRQAKVRLTIWNTGPREITLATKDISVVDTEGRSAAVAEKLRVGPEPEKFSPAHALLVPHMVLMCVVLMPVCATLMIGGSAAERARHKTAVVIPSGKDETISVSIHENLVRFDTLSVVRVRRQDTGTIVELPITDSAWLPASR